MAEKLATLGPGTHCTAVCLLRTHRQESVRLVQIKALIDFGHPDLEKKKTQYMKAERWRKTAK